MTTTPKPHRILDLAIVLAGAAVIAQLWVWAAGDTIETLRLLAAAQPWPPGWITTKATFWIAAVATTTLGLLATLKIAGLRRDALVDIALIGTGLAVAVTLLRWLADDAALAYAGLAAGEALATGQLGDLTTKAAAALGAAALCVWLASPRITRSEARRRATGAEPDEERAAS